MLTVLFSPPIPAPSDLSHGAEISLVVVATKEDLRNGLWGNFFPVQEGAIPGVTALTFIMKKGFRFLVRRVGKASRWGGYCLELEYNNEAYLLLVEYSIPWAALYKHTAERAATLHWE